MFQPEYCLKMSKILITRSADQGQGFIEKFSDPSIEFLLEPILRIERFSVDVDCLDYDCVLITSQNAAEDIPSDLPVLRVGQDGVRDVKDLISRLDAERRYLYLRGADVSYDLQKMGYHIDEIVTYKAYAVQYFSPGFLRALDSGEVAAFTFFSVRSAQIFFELSQENKLLERMKRIKVLCISPRVVEYVYSVFDADVRVAEQPNVQGMMDLIKDFTNEQRN